MDGPATVDLMEGALRIVDFQGKIARGFAWNRRTGNIVRFALGKGVELEALSPQELQPFSPHFGEDFQAAISLQATIDCHDVIGGTATARVQQALLLARVRAAERSRAPVGEASHA